MSCLPSPSHPHSLPPHFLPHLSVPPLSPLPSPLCLVPSPPSPLCLPPSPLPICLVPSPSLTPFLFLLLFYRLLSEERWRESQNQLGFASSATTSVGTVFHTLFLSSLFYLVLFSPSYFSLVLSLSSCLCNLSLRWVGPSVGG